MEETLHRAIREVSYYETLAIQGKDVLPPEQILQAIIRHNEAEENVRELLRKGQRTTDDISLTAGIEGAFRAKEEIKRIKNNGGTPSL